MIAAEVSKRQKKTTWVAIGGASLAVAAAVWAMTTFTGPPDSGTAPNAAIGNPANSTPPAPGPSGNTGPAEKQQVAASDSVPTATPLAPRGNSGAQPPQSTSRGTAQTEGRGRAGAPPPAGVVPATALDTAVLRPIQNTADEARRAALRDGATSAELARGDSALREANLSISQRRPTTTTVTQLSFATQAFNDAARSARQRAAAAERAAVQQPPPVVNNPPPVRSETAARQPADPRPEIERAIAAYANALQSENIAGVRAIYPGLTSAQAGAWQRLFGAADSLRTRHTVTAVQVSGATATVTVSALHEFRNRDDRGRAVRSEFPYTATLTREGDTWRITRIQ